jgi:MoaA/NifB/PqqE/SkfB family radical SAM enzyme
MKIESPQANFELIQRFLHRPARRPNRIQVEITNRCNLDCPMCPRISYGLPIKDMDFEVFRKIMARLKEAELIIPVGWGESFVHPDFGKIIDSLLVDCHKIKIATNGLLLDDPRQRAIALKVDYLTFSFEFHGDTGGQGHSNERIIHNIRSIVAARGKGRKPYICLQTVLLKENKEIPGIIKLANDLGVDRVNIVRPYLKFEKDMGLAWPQRKVIYLEAEKLGKKLGLRVDMFEYASFAGMKRFFWKHLKEIFRVNSWCPRLYDFVYVTIGGKVTPCCALPRHIVGDLMQQSITEIWHGEKMNEFRKNHIAICKDCDVFKVK